MKEFIIIIVGSVSFSLIVALITTLLGTKKPKKLYKIEYKERVQIMPIRSSAKVTARTPKSAVKKFHKDYGPNFDINNVIEIKT